MVKKPEVVAVFNTSPDTVNLIRYSLERAGFVVVTAHLHEIREGTVDLEHLVRVHHPRVVLYDISPPYDWNWNFLNHLRTTAPTRECHFVLTSPNPGRVQQMVGTDEHIYEIIGTPKDLDEVVRAVKEASRAKWMDGSKEKEEGGRGRMKEEGGLSGLRIVVD